MRRVTQQEAERWRTLAQQHGFGSAEGRFVLGRFIVEDRDENGLVLCVVTPIPAGLDAEKHQLKTPPVMFDRTPADEIVVPSEARFFAKHWRWPRPYGEAGDKEQDDDARRWLLS
jgi:hypothetical protein